VLALMLELSGNWWEAEAYIRWCHRTGRGEYGQGSAEGARAKREQRARIPAPASVFFTPVLASMWGQSVDAGECGVT
jgi:hypothetical protein